MSRNNDLRTFFVDFPELPWYCTLKVYTRTKRDAVQAAPPRASGATFRCLMGKVCGK